MKLHFLGAAQTVTGSRHLLKTERSNILLDCGLFQGKRTESLRRNQNLSFDPSRIDAVVLSHAHIDHSGALPLLCKQGYSGPIFATPATRDLCAVMLEDAAMIQASDARYLNRAIEKHHLDADPIEPLYDQRDVQKVLQQMVGVPYHRLQSIAPDVQLTFLDAGHVLGSAITLLDVEEKDFVKRVAFTGDLGRRGLPILRDPEVPENVTTLITESTYGDRLHTPFVDMADELANVIKRTIEKRGKLIVPSFAFERAQELIYSIKQLRNANKIPPIPVYVDSPLTVNITQVFRLHPDCYDAPAQTLLQGGDSPFEFPELHYVASVEESMALDVSEEPSIIISASGMCEAGRILHHLKATIEDPKNTILIVGFQAPHTLGRRIVERRRVVRMFGVERNLRAEVVVLNGFSAHADQCDLVEFAQAVKRKSQLSQVFLVHGELPAQQALQKMLLAKDFSNVHIPEFGESVEV